MKLSFIFQGWRYRRPALKQYDGVDLLQEQLLKGFAELKQMAFSLLRPLCTFKSRVSKKTSLKNLFPIFILISFTTILLVDSFKRAIAQLPRQEIRGVWMTNNDFDTLKNRAKVQDAVSQLRRLNFNTIYPVVWNSGYVMYPSAVAQRTGIQPFVSRGLDGHDILADLITKPIVKVYW